MTVVLVCDFNCVKMTVLAHCQGRPFCKRKSRKGAMKMLALYLVCVACDVGMGFKYNLEGRAYMRNKLVKLSIECNTVYIHTCIHTYTYLHTYANRA